MSIFIFWWGDGDFIETKLQAIEKRAFENKNTYFDIFFLRSLYQSMIFFGQFHYPNASKMLAHYCEAQKDTIFFDAEKLYNENTELQFAVEKNKTGIIFRPYQSKDKTVHISSSFDWDLYYAFDLLSIRKEGKKVILYDRYVFAPLERKNYTPFKFGKIKFNLNDGLIHIAYPDAKGFMIYGEFILP
jgi:hypothetical protein